MNRRLRLALLLAALAAAGPSAAAPQAFETARSTVSIAWVRADPASRPQRQTVNRAIHVAAVAHVAFIAQQHAVLPDSLRLHSLFQRPPPLYS